MKLLMNFFRKKEKSPAATRQVPKKKKREITPERIGELGEYKINLQLEQFPPNHKHISDLMLKNPKAKSGYSQIDHIFICPYGIFVIETKNYAGKIYGGKENKQWTVNGKFKMMNPFRQNYGHIESIKACLENCDDNSFISMISFTKRAVFNISPELRKIQSDDLCVYDTELTEYINRKIHVIKLQNSKPRFSDEEIITMYNTLTELNVDDPVQREKHKRAFKGEAACVICKDTVSDKVRKYCLSHKKFEGKIYCYTHQKSIK
ncbi:nuclease-related domain-containing protein [Thalassobacillus pellis]|uniref:nuclease-related domain-containing protein n=1 Tax=Thalassobacillus pellis TaxID=748008 RepID=UPI0019609CEF|nr:nuclease-related domain-containing protein [Thalassobacillus pellis]MBM7553242.1 hypothetical protein [Thalassobacillus pellis]